MTFVQYDPSTPPTKSLIPPVTPQQIFMHLHYFKIIIMLQCIVAQTHKYIHWNRLELVFLYMSDVLGHMVWFYT